MQKNLYMATGILNLLLGVFHLFFWKIFDWPQGLLSISIDNRAIIQIGTVQMMLLLLFFGYVSIAHWKDLFLTRIGKSISLFMAIFYLTRILL